MNFKITKLIIVIILFLIVGCSNISIEEVVSENTAKNLVLKKHAKHIGTPSIIKVEIKNNEYYIEWENKENKEWGIDKVTKEKEVIMINARIE